eukprot:3794432-Alexandrium_andersonii.AAC.1
MAGHFIEDVGADTSVIFGGPVILPSLWIRWDTLDLRICCRGTLGHGNTPREVTGLSTPRGGPDRIQRA